MRTYTVSSWCILYTKVIYTISLNLQLFMFNTSAVDMSFQGTDDDKERFLGDLQHLSME